MTTHRWKEIREAFSKLTEGKRRAIDEGIISALGHLDGSWNYRVVRYASGGYGVHEIYYDESGNPRSRTERAIVAVTDEEGPEGLRASLELMLEDCSNEVIQDAVFEDAEKDNE